LTKIGSAQRGLNPVLDQIISQAAARSDTGTSKDGGAAPGFDSHLARFTLNNLGANGLPASDAEAQEETAGTSKQLGGKAALDSQFAQFVQDAGVTPLAKEASAVSLAATPMGASPAQKTPEDSVSALFAALNSADQTHDMNTGRGGPPASVSATGLGTAGLPDMNTTADGVDSPASFIRSSGWTRFTQQRSSSSAAYGMPRSSAPAVSKHSGQSGNLPSDLPAAAQTAIAMVAASLTPQNTSVPASRKDVAAPGAGPNGQSLHSAHTLSAGSANVQSESDSVQTLTEKDSSGTFGDFSESDDSASQAIKMNVSSIQAETHFAPVQHLSPTQQIADIVSLNISSSAGGDSTDSGVAAAGSDLAANTSSATVTQGPSSPVKMLTLALEPNELGTVTIKMRLIDSGLDLQVEAERSATTALIEKDKGNLSDKLQALGYSVDSLVVKTAMVQGSHLDPSNDQAAAGQAQQAANDASASGSSANGGRNSNDQSPTQSGSQDPGALSQKADAGPAPARNAGDGIYL